MISSFYNSIELYSYSSIIYFSAPTKISHILVLYSFFIYNDFAMLDSQPILTLYTETEN